MLDLARCIKKTQILVWKKHSFLCVTSRLNMHSIPLDYSCSALDQYLAKQHIYLNIYPLSVPLRAAAV